MTSQSINQITARAAQEVAEFIGVTAHVAMRDHADAYVAKVGVAPCSAIRALVLGLWFAVCVTAAHAPIHRIE